MHICSNPLTCFPSPDWRKLKGTTQLSLRGQILPSKRTTFTSTPSRTALLAILLLLGLSPVALSQPQNRDKGKNETSTPSTGPADITFWNRHIATMRVNLAGSDPQERAQRAIDKLQELPLGTTIDQIEEHEIQVEGLEGFGYTYKGRVLLYLSTGDLDKESGETLAAGAQTTLNNLRDALQAREDERRWPVIRQGVLYTLIGLAALVAFLWVVWKVFHIIYDYLHAKERSFTFRLRIFGIDLVPHIAGLLYTVLRVLAWMLTFGALYAWMTLSLGQFPYTAPWSSQLGGYFFRFFAHLGLAAINALPGVFSCIVIFLITRWVVRLGRAFFRQVSSGALRVSWMDPDVAHATERIFTFIAWVFAAVVAYPYIPGSSTEAFKGISVFFGLVVSLGSTGIINQIMSGMFVVYSKALKTGDWVVVNDKEGEVLEVGLLAVKIRTIEQQEVTIPHSVIVSTTTTNYTRIGQDDASVVTVTVTIGYNAPWRQVHALLLLAAERTANLRQTPAPYVVQRSLSDFYVGYSLVVHLESEKLRIETLSQLNANIQDAFNEYGVQIMSPHFMVQPEQEIVVPRSKWHAEPAGPDNGESAQIGDKHFKAGK
jgi:small-conductance mechanosensitive channel